MTEQLVQIWQEMHGLSRIKALLELKYLTDILASNKTSPAPTEDTNAQPDPILPQMDDPYEDPNQVCLEI